LSACDNGGEIKNKNTGFTSFDDKTIKKSSQESPLEAIDLIQGLCQDTSLKDYKAAQFR